MPLIIVSSHHSTGEVVVRRSHSMLLDGTSHRWDRETLTECIALKLL